MLFGYIYYDETTNKDYPKIKKLGEKRQKNCERVRCEKKTIPQVCPQAIPLASKVQLLQIPDGQSK